MTNTKARGLDPTIIVTAAVALADAEGLAAVSMRPLGRILGVEAMSLYHHLPTKAALLAAMLEQVRAEVPTQTDPDWQAALRHHARALRACLNRHRWMVEVLCADPTPGPVARAQRAQTVAGLVTTGFSAWAADQVAAMVDALVMGTVLQEPVGQPDPAADDNFEVALDLFLDAAGRALW